MQTEPATLPLQEAEQLVPLDRLELSILQNALAFHGGNVSKAAKALGIARTTFYRKIKEASREADR